MTEMHEDGGGGQNLGEIKNIMVKNFFSLKMTEMHEEGGGAEFG